MHIEKILIDITKRKGAFDPRASISQQLKNTMRYQTNWDDLSDNKKEALEMISDKISTILNGDSDDAKSWYSIAGYAKLVGDTSNELKNANNDVLINE